MILLIFFFFFLLVIFCCFNFGGKFGGISLVFLLFLFFILSGLIKKLGILGRSRRKSFKSLRFIPAMVFHHFLSLDLIYNDVGWLPCLKVMLIGFLYVKTRLYICFSLGCYCFCYQLFIAVQLVIFWSITALIKSFKLLLKYVTTTNSVSIAAKLNFIKIN